MQDNAVITALHKFLPDSIKELLDVVSVEAVIVLIERYGGTRVSVPKTALADHPLTALLGMDDFSKLCVYCQGTNSLDIPRCTSARTALRDSQLLKDSRAGLGLAELARKYEIGERGVSKALRRIEKHEYQPWLKEAQTKNWQQGDLFDDN